MLGLNSAAGSGNPSMREALPHGVASHMWSETVFSSECERRCHHATRATYINSTYDGGNMAQFSHAPQLHPCMSGHLSTLLLNYKFYRVGQVVPLEPAFISLAVLRQSVSSLRIHLLLQLPAYPG